MDFKAGKIQFGSYPQSVSFIKEPITWIRVAEDYENTTTLFMSEKILIPWIVEKVSWENSNLRKYLNNKFINEAFTNEEVKLLQQIESGENKRIKIYSYSLKHYNDVSICKNVKDKIILPTLNITLQDINNPIMLRSIISKGEPTYLCKKIHSLNNIFNEAPRFINQKIFEIEVNYWMLADTITNIYDELNPLVCLNNAFINPYKNTTINLSVTGIRPCILLKNNTFNIVE